MDIKIIIFLLSKIASGIAVAQLLPLFLRMQTLLHRMLYWNRILPAG